MSDREHTLQILRQHRDRLLDKRARVAAEHAKARADQDKYAEISRQRSIEYQSTQRGIAESIRELELSMHTGQPMHVIRGLRRHHLAAEEVSAAEYRTRSARWGHTPGDGPVRGCSVGTHEVLQPLILRDQVLGSYRHDPHAAAVRISLYRRIGQQLLATKVTVPADTPLDLCSILVAAFTDRRTHGRLLQRLQLDDPAWNGRRATPEVAAAAGDGR